MRRIQFAQLPIKRFAAAIDDVAKSTVKIFGYAFKVIQICRQVYPFCGLVMKCRKDDVFEGVICCFCAVKANCSIYIPVVQKNSHK